MKRVGSIALTVLVSGLWWVLLWVSAPAVAADLKQGAQVFEVHCVGCHVNGGNIVRRGKNLKLKTLQRNGYDSIETISQLVANGKGLMSAYGDRLSDTEIESVAAYVLDRAEQGWK
ncbi:c-type cytochrome [Egbenema bharatensis]|uniref:c-type cytochrome n=1 Tax=Egbenema bharatensis TaxID=3463334 RepID=UPI003A8A0820